MSFAQEQVVTNLDIFRSLAKQIAIETARAARIERGTRVRISVLPKEASWYIAGALGDGMKMEGVNVGEDPLSPSGAEFGIAAGRVVYSNIRRDGFLGTKLVDRAVELRLTTTVTTGGTILWSGDVEKRETDTIAVDEILRLETPTIPITQGTLPREGFFSNVAEPLILIGSIAVAVLLLFHVRS